LIKHFCEYLEINEIEVQKAISSPKD